MITTSVRSVSDNTRRYSFFIPNRPVTPCRQPFFRSFIDSSVSQRQGAMRRARRDASGHAEKPASPDTKRGGIPASHACVSARRINSPKSASSTGALLFGEQPGIILVVTFVAVDDDVLRRRDQAMLNAAVAADGFLIGPRVEKTDILRSSPQFRQKDRIRVRLPVVIVLAVAGQPPRKTRCTRGPSY